MLLFKRVFSHSHRRLREPIREYNAPGVCDKIDEHACLYAGIANRLQYIPPDPNGTATAVIRSDITKPNVSGVMYHKNFAGSRPFENVNLHRVASNLQMLGGSGGKFVSAITGMPDSVFERFEAKPSEDPLSDNKSSVTLIPTIQDDLTITNAARVSFKKHSGTFIKKSESKTTRSDEGLINFLLLHNHWTPVSQVNFLFACSMTRKEYVYYLLLASKYQMSHYVTFNEEDRVEFFERGSAYAYLQLERNGVKLPPEILEFLPYACDAHDKANPTEIWKQYHTLKVEKTLINDCFFWNDNRNTWLYPQLTNFDTSDLFTLTFRIKLPIFVVRQLGKHQVGITVNEESRRYISDVPDFYIPKVYREHNANLKQGSKDTQVPLNDIAYLVTKRTVETALAGYSALKDSYNVCREQSRIVLPQNMYTECVQTGTVAAFQNLLKLRLATDAQWEIRQYAKAILKLAKQSEHARFFYHINDTDIQNK